MSRYLTNDYTNRDPRALLNSAKMATLSECAIPIKQYITATGADSLRIEEGCVISIYGGGVFKTDTTVLTAANLDAGAAFVAGNDYYIYLCDLGSTNDEVYKISLNSTYPAGFTASTSRKIGGFHYGKCRNVNTALQPINASNVIRGTGWESSVFDGIIPRSVWTMAHRPKCNPEGMVYLSSGTWVDIYISSDDGSGGVASEKGATPLTGTEGLNWYGFVERALVSGKRLLSYEEWLQAAFGSPQGLADANTNAWSATTNTGRQVCGYVDNAVSAVGCRDCVGNVLEWTNELVTRAEHAVTSGNGHGTTGQWAWDATSPFGDGYGNIYQYYDMSIVALVAGGFWNHGVQAGARCVYLSHYPWNVAASIGARCGCDSL